MSIPKKIIFIIIILILVIGITFAVYEYRRKGRVCFKDNCFEVELARTREEQAQGLMFRQSLSRDKGMLFIFPGEGIYSFWMKNTLIPLDIIWINENKEVVFISENILPCEKDPCPLFGPDKKANYVLEINGGVSKEIGLKVGDKVESDISKY